MSCLVVGCGYAGERIAALHAARGEAVTGTTRDAIRATRLRAAGVVVPAPGSTLPAARCVYYTVPPPDAGASDPRLAESLAALPPPKVFVYFGTTSVYGDAGGAMVDETAPLRPESDRARRRLNAERQVRAWCEARGVRFAILRVAGIYGPGRLPLSKLRAREPVPAESGPGNRIHVDDLAAAAIVIAAFVQREGESGTWNVSDGNPLSNADFNDLVADQAGLPRPRRVPLDSPEISPGLRSFLRETRRIDNRKLLSVPGFRLRYPDPIDGIRQSIAI